MLYTRLSSSYNLSASLSSAAIEGTSKMSFMLSLVQVECLQVTVYQVPAEQRPGSSWKGDVKVGGIRLNFIRGLEVTFN